MISVPNKAVTEGPKINWKHVDGPLMNWAGELHWLTWIEIWQLRSKSWTLDDVATKRFPHLAKIRAELSSQ